MKIFLLLSVMLLFLLFDLLLGNLALFCALSVYAAGCFALSYGYGYGFAAAAFAGAALDGICSRPVSWLPLLFIVAVTLILTLIRRGRGGILAIPAAGVAAGLVIAAGSMGISFGYRAPLPGPEILSTLIFNGVLGGCLLPLLIMIFDFFSSRANLPRCIEVEGPSPRRKHRRVSRSELKGGNRR